MFLLVGCLYREGAEPPTPESDRALPGPAYADAPTLGRVGLGLSGAVAAVIDTYPVDGSYSFYWPPDDGRWWGTTRDVRYRGLLLSPGDPEHRSHCVGLTWEVAMQVLSEAAGSEDAAINSLSLTAIVHFRKDWFVADLYGAGAGRGAQRRVRSVGA